MSESVVYERWMDCRMYESVVKDRKKDMSGLGTIILGEEK